MYIIYNQDGSVKSIKLTDFIQRGNNNINSIFLAIEGKNNDEWAATTIFALPDGTKVALTPIATTKNIFDKVYKGWEISLPLSVTIFEGLVAFSVTVLNLQNVVLFTYNGKLTINPSIINPDVTNITYAQYQALLQYIISVIGNDEVGLPIKRVIATFNTNSFEIPEGSDYYKASVNLSNFIPNSDLLIITWGNSFVACPIPASGKGHVVGALINNNGISQVVRVGYELKSDNTILEISLESGFRPGAGYTGYVINYRIASN